MFLTEYTDINSNLNIDNMPLIISTSAISDLLTSPCKSYDNKFMAMIDSGANVAIASIDLVLALGVKMRPHDDSRRIGTANKNSELIIIGWIFENMDVYTGRIAIVENKLSYVLLSASAMQDHGMQQIFHLIRASATWIMSTVALQQSRETLQIIYILLTYEDC